MRCPLTVLIPCKNEESNIAACIASAREIADEILVADSLSTDRTLEIVQHLGGCRIIQREYIDYGNFNNWAIPQATHPWVLLIDADERLTDPLRREIARLLASPPCHDGYWIYRDNYFMGRRIRFSGWQRNRVLRLFRRDLGRFNDAGDHSRLVIATGNVGRLHHRLLHFTYTSYDQYFRKFHRYTKLQAQRWFAEGRQVGWFDLALAGPARFLRAYILQLGFLDGLAGLQVCMLTGFYSFAKRARLWELWAQHEAARLQGDESQGDPPGPAVGLATSGSNFSVPQARAPLRRAS